MRVIYQDKCCDSYVMIICLFPAVAGRLTVARRLSPWSSIAISVLLQHHWDKQAPMFAATGETEASSPAGDGRNAARGGGAHAPSTARVPGAVVRSLYAEINLET